MVKSNLKITLNLDKSQKGIWRFSSYLSPVPAKYKLTLGEGETKEINLASENVSLKREDQNPSGSLKDRGMAYLISHAYSQKENKFVLSSSGNAAISAFFYCRLAGLRLKIFVSKNIEKGKLSVLKSERADLQIVEKPLSSAANFSKENGFYNLRPSINKFGSEGYQTTAFEIALSQPLVSDIFLPVSSGVNLIGIYQGYQKLGIMPRLHLCQPSALCPMAGEFDKVYVRENTKLTTGLVTKNSPLKDQVIMAVKKSNGFGWVIDNTQLISAQKLLEESQIITSFEGALSLAALLKAREKGWKIEKPLCLLTGKRY